MVNRWNRDRSVLALAFVVIALLLAAGCGDDDPGDPTTDTIYPPADPIAAFEIAYEEQRIDALAALLHPDFQMILRSATCTEWHWPLGTTFDRPDMISIHTNVFSGQAGATSSGNPVAPTAVITIDLLDLQSIWAPIAEDDLYFPGSEGKWATCEIDIRFTDAEDSHTYQVEQEVIFYVTPVTVEGHFGYQLLGIKELAVESKASTDPALWGDVLALYF